MPAGRPWEYFDEDYYRQQAAGLPSQPAVMPSTTVSRQPVGLEIPQRPQEQKNTGPSGGSKMAAGIGTLAGGLMMLIPGAQAAGAATMAASQAIPAIDSAARGGGAGQVGSALGHAGNAAAQYGKFDRAMQSREKTNTGPTPPAEQQGQESQARAMPPMQQPSMIGMSQEERRRMAAMGRMPWWAA